MVKYLSAFYNNKKFKLLAVQHQISPTCRLIWSLSSHCRISSNKTCAAPSTPACPDRD